MASTNTKSTLDSMFKYAVADKADNLIPQNLVLYKMLGGIKPAQKIGRKYLMPVALSAENGVTYGDDTAFALNASVAGVYGEMQLTSYPVVLSTKLSQSVANALANDEKAFVDWSSIRAENMMNSLSKRAEIELWLGKSGLGTVSTSAVSTNATITFTDATWAPGVWGGMEGAVLEARSSGSLVNTNADLVIVSVNWDLKQIVVSGNSTDLNALAAGNILFFKGAYTNSMYGVKAILTNTASLFNIDASTYQLWKTTNYPVGSASFSVSKALKAVAKGVGKGGLDSDVNCFVSSTTYESMNSDFAALRQIDSSYSTSKGENGVAKLQYVCQSGVITIVPCAFIMEGEAFIIPKNGITKVGTTDLTFSTGAGPEDFFLPLSGAAGYELRAQYDFAIFIPKPAQCVYISGIVNS